MFQEAPEELGVEDVSVMVARVPDSVSTVEVNVMLELTGSVVEPTLEGTPPV